MREVVPLRQSLERMFEQSKERHSNRYKNAQTTDVHGELVVVQNGLEAVWPPTDEISGLEIFTRERLLYPTIASFSLRHGLGISYNETRRRRNSYFASRELGPDELKFVLSTVIYEPEAGFPQDSAMASVSSVATDMIQ